MVIPSLHKLALDLGGCQGATCCELWVTRRGFRTPRGWPEGGLKARGVPGPLMLPGISTEGVRSVGGYNYKGNGRGGFNRERENRENWRGSEWTREYQWESYSSIRWTNISYDDWWRNGSKIIPVQVAINQWAVEEKRTHMCFSGDTLTQSIVVHSIRR